MRGDAGLAHAEAAAGSDGAAPSLSKDALLELTAPPLSSSAVHKASGGEGAESQEIELGNSHRVEIVSGLSLVGINVTAIVGTASVAGLAFGFGAQKLVKDVITGYFLLLEDQYVAGDYITIGTVTGTVEELGMRITRIRDDDGKLYILSNGDIAQVCNHSRGLVGASFELSVGAAEDIAAVTKIIEETLATQNLPAPARVEGITLADATKTTLRITFKAPHGQRPAQILPHLRATLRDALLAANITLA